MSSLRSKASQWGLLGAGLVLALLFLSEGVFAREMEKCTRCHDETEAYPVLNILQTPHASQADPRIPFGSEGCEECHGSADDHLRPPAEGEKRIQPPMVFRRGERPAEEQNAVCLQCHESGDRMHWRGSQHDFQGLACVSCHTIHTTRDKVLVKQEQPQVCVRCHTEKRAEMLRPSSHPVFEGKMACTDCHNPHGALTESMLVEPTLVETCYTCHAEKRGPFLWEHAPVREDCSICHNPHGSIHASMLNSRGPWMCQQCHLGSHSSAAFDGRGVPPQGATPQIIGQSCLNCHSQVHGSNNPAGPGFTR
jgi:DmsE family decaheme c-type cytochrome